MNIYNYLRKDHQKVSELMESVLSETSPARRKEIFESIREELTLHAEAEQATFYAALEDTSQTEENIEDAEDDHEEIKQYINILSSMSAESPQWIEVFGEFKHAVEHHVKDEEGRIFEKAQQVLGARQAEELAEEMDRMKQEAAADAA